MEWKNLGLVFAVQGQNSWMQTHAQSPVVIPGGESHPRVLFSTRDKNKVASVGCLDFDLKSLRVLEVDSKPVLTPGKPGHFDQHGVYPSCVLEVNDKLYLYYIGYTRGQSPHLFYASIGLALSQDGGMSFQRMHDCPILERSPFDPCLVTAPHVIRHGDGFRMYYVSGVSWQLIDGCYYSRYNIKLALSKDGIHWQREGRVILDFKDSTESNLGKPTVLNEEDFFQMWYCFATPALGKGYRIGYAESNDGLVFKRQNEKLGLPPAPDGSDSKMSCYPHVIRYEGSQYLFYNGNEHGKYGFGLAVSSEASRAPGETYASKRQPIQLT